MEEAVSVFREIISLNPDVAGARFRLGMALIMKGARPVKRCPTNSKSLSIQNAGAIQRSAIARANRRIVATFNRS